MAPQHLYDDGVAKSSPHIQIAAPNNNFRHLSRSPHPYHRRGSKLFDGDNTATGNAESFQQTRRWGMTPKSSSDSGTEADDESTGLLKGLPAPPTRARKGLRGIRSNDGSPDSGSALDQPWLSQQKIRPQHTGGGVTDRIDAETLEALRKTAKRRRVAILRRLSETVLLLAVGVAVFARSEVRVAACVWKRGEQTRPGRPAN